MAAIGSMLRKGHRREDDAEARLRPYQVMERNIRESQGVASKEPSGQLLVRKLKKGDWKTVLPMIAGLVQPENSGIPISIQVTKKDGFPVRIDPNASAAVAFKYARDEDRYPYLTGELAEKLGIKTWQAVELAKLFKIKGSAEFHNRSKVSKSSFVQRYNDKARRVMEVALARDGFEKLWAAAKAGEHRDPREYLRSGSEERASEAVAATSEVVAGAAQ